MALRRAAGMPVYVVVVACVCAALARSASAMPIAPPVVVAGGGASTSIAYDYNPPFPVPTAVKFKPPGQIAAEDSGGRLWIPVPGSNQIYEVAVGSTIDTIAGATDQHPASPTDGQLADSQPLNHAKYMTFGADRLYFVDGNRIRQIALNDPRNVSTAAGSDTAGNANGDALTTAHFDAPHGLSAFNVNNGSILGYYVADTLVAGNGNDLIREVIRGASADTVSTVAGSTDLNALRPREPDEQGYPSAPTSAAIGAVTALSAINDSELWIVSASQYGGSWLYKVFHDPVQNNVLAIERMSGPDPHTGTVVQPAAGLNSKDVAFGPITSVQALRDGGALVLVSNPSKIWRIGSDGTLSVVADNLLGPGLVDEAYMTMSDAGLYFTTYGDYSSQTPYGTVSTIPGLVVTSGPTPDGSVATYTRSRAATFTFASWDKDTAVSCRLGGIGGGGGGMASPCLSTAYGPFADGPHRMIFTGQADNGTRTTGAAWDWIVDGTEPTPPLLDGPADGSLTASKTPTFRWEPTTDPVVNSASSGFDHYELFIDNVKSGGDIAPGQCTPGCSAQPAAPLADVPHSWFIKAVDTVGNEGPTTARTLTVDTTAPTPATGTAPADGTETGDATPELTWDAASDAGSSVTAYDIELDGKALGLALPASARSYKPPVALSDGTHTWRVLATDGVANTSASASRSFRVDTVAPTATVAASPNPVLAGQQVTIDGSGSSDPSGGHITHYEFDLDGDGVFEQDNGASATMTRTFSAAGTHTLGIRVTDSVGHAATATTQLKVSLSPVAAGQAGVTINNGAQYTRTPDVTLFIKAPAATTQLLVSNDGGFLDPQVFAPQAQIPWRLDSSGPERLPKTVYVRFLTGPFASPNFTDDIILDETPPVVEQAAVAPAAGASAARAARTAAWRVKVRATDSNSGVKSVQVTADKRKPWPLLAYKPKLTVRSAKRPAFIRARDRAGNLSSWHKATRR